MQKSVILNGAGLAVARDIASRQTKPAMNWKSVEFRDGFTGERGGLGILRNGRDTAATMVLMKYGVHGEGHGHFDKLNLTFFDSGREVLPDYGFSRWINIEPKFGGRYLPENDSYAMQTVAHNTVVVDQKSQNLAKEDSAEARWGKRNFFDASNPAIQVMSARANDHYPGVAMQRTAVLIRDARLEFPVLVDLYRLASRTTHSYDYVLHHRGQLIATNVRYEADSAVRRPLGNAFGYQHIWREAHGKTDSIFRMTFLDGRRYYSILSASTAGSEIIFGRIGAHDPNFALTSEPLVIKRVTGSDHLFATVVEPHGFFSEAHERSLEARGRITDVRILFDGAEGSVVEVTGAKGIRWTIMIVNTTGPARHSVRAGSETFEWNGNFSVRGVQAVR